MVLHHLHEHVQYLHLMHVIYDEIDNIHDLSILTQLHVCNIPAIIKAAAARKSVAFT